MAAEPAADLGAGYVLQGNGRIHFGEGFRESEDMAEGDFVVAPPFMPHVGCNMSTKHDLVWLTTRTPDNLVVEGAARV